MIVTLVAMVLSVTVAAAAAAVLAEHPEAEAAAAASAGLVIAVGVAVICAIDLCKSCPCIYIDFSRHKTSNIKRIEISVIDIYLWIVVYSFYHEVKEGGSPPTYKA